MTTKLGIITNYENVNLSLDPIQDPRIIKLGTYLGLASNNGPETNVEKIIENTASISDNNTDGIEARNEFLDNNFKNKFEDFDKLETTKSLPIPFTTSFSVKKLIIIYLEATQNGNNWNTTGNDNRIYLFDNQGKELKEKKGDKENLGIATVNFFRIKIYNNVLSITTEDGEVFKFTTTDISEMTLAKLISSLLGSEIEYKGTDNTGPFKPKLKTTGPERVTQSSNTAGEENEEELTESFVGGTGGKKSRKKQRKGGKKSRKKRKSMRKNKRSRSKK